MMLDPVSNFAAKRPERDTSGARTAFLRLSAYLAGQIIGQEILVERLLVSLLGDGHLLVEGPPGLAKTRAIKALAHAVEGDFQRVQFTPDMLPRTSRGRKSTAPKRALSASSADRSFTTSFWLTRSIARLRRCSPLCWRPWPSGRSAWARRATPCPAITHRRSRPSQPLPREDVQRSRLTSANARALFREACRTNDAPAARFHLLTWASAAWEGKAPTGLNELARAMEDPSLSASLRELDRACYGGGSWQGEKLANSLTELPSQGRRSKGRRRDQLAPLYY